MECFCFSKSHATSMGLRKDSAIGLQEQKYDPWNEGGDRLGVPGFSKMSPESSTWL